MAYADAIDKDGSTHWLGAAGGGPGAEQVAIGGTPGSSPPVPSPEHGLAYWLGSWQVMLACQLGDIVSTYWALHHNPKASEDNPIQTGPLDAIKVAIPIALWRIDWNDMGAVGIRIGVNALACMPIINNIHVGRSR